MVCSCLKKTHLLAVVSWKWLSSGRAGREEGTGWVEPTVYSRLGVKDKQKPGRRLRSATAASRGQNWVASSPGSLFQGERRKQGLSTRGSHAVPVPNGRLLLGREWSHITVTLGEGSRRGGCSASSLPIATLPLSSCSLGNSRAAGPSGSLLPLLGAVCLSLLRPGGCAIPGWLILIKTVLWIVEGGTVGGWETGGALGKGLIMKWHERGQRVCPSCSNCPEKDRCSQVVQELTPVQGESGIHHQGGYHSHRGKGGSDAFLLQTDKAQRPSHKHMSEVQPSCETLFPKLHD